MPTSFRPLAGLVMAAVLASCAAPSPSPSAEPDASVAPTVSARPTASATVSATEEPTGGDPPPLALEQVASGLDAPINIVGTPDGTLLVNERNGRVLAVDPATGEASVLLETGARVSTFGEDVEGELYLADVEAGTIYRVVAGG